jgi:glycosyltransferase involved in cell wall biosynthesis
MKILILSFYYEPDLCAGSFRTTALTEELKKNISSSDTLDIITTMPNRYSSFNDDALNYEENNNIKINRIDLGSHKSGFVDQSLLFMKFAFNVLKIIRKREKYDVIYATSSRLMTAFLGALISNRQKSKLFLDLRDIFTDTLESVFAKSKLRHIIPVFKQIEKYTINSATHINLVSKGFEKYFLNINKTVKYSFNSNGIDNIFLDYDFNLTKENKKKIITYAGNIGEGQGLEKIIPNIAKIVGEDYEIHIYGDGGTKEKLVKNSQGLVNIKLFNPINREKLLEVYKNSDFLFLHLNDYEAFKKVLPSKLFEYAATNKFIIAGVGGYAQEFIKENITNSIVFEPCNINDFEEKFNKINIDEKIDRKVFMGKFSRASIMNDLSKKVYEL